MSGSLACYYWGIGVCAKTSDEGIVVEAIHRTLPCGDRLCGVTIPAGENYYTGRVLQFYSSKVDLSPVGNTSQDLETQSRNKLNLIIE